MVRYRADLHIHSHYSRATSKQSNLQGLTAWAAVKGIDVLGTGDFTHPGWFRELCTCLEEAEPGFFTLKKEYLPEYAQVLPTGYQFTGLEKRRKGEKATRFVLSAEVSSIYKRGGKVRKVHNILFAPSLAAAAQVNMALAKIGNLEADGRPILGLDSRDLLEIMLEHNPDGFLVPAHIWTPWFSLFGSKSGFDAIEDCFADLTPHIFALETGLSSDPEMNRLISALDRFTLISNSDCHSPAKLGREVNLFDTDFDYFSMRRAIQFPSNQEGKQVFTGTVEFYPEEGKYHADGHRNCGVCLQPAESRGLGNICPACGKPLTIGVLNRVMELADRSDPLYPQHSPQVFSLTPLAEVLSELLTVGSASKKVMKAYTGLINTFGSEFSLLLDTPLAEIQTRGSDILAEAIRRMRSNEVFRQPGFDGEFGRITVFAEGELASLFGQISLFGVTPQKARKKKRQADPAFSAKQANAPQKQVKEKSLGKLNSRQKKAAETKAQHIVVQAGPGTGKTHTLVSRVCASVCAGTAPCTVITFTNKAAQEVRERLAGEKKPHTEVMVATFHGYCLYWLRTLTPGLTVLGPGERKELLLERFPNLSAKELRLYDEQIDQYFLNGSTANTQEKREYPAFISEYLESLTATKHIDLDAIIFTLVNLLEQDQDVAAAVRAGTGHLFVDEFQDINAMQYRLVSLLAESQNVFAIGDPDQAIYGFRGASPIWFHRFVNDFGAEVHQLNMNYRSGTDLVAAAEALIEQNDRQLDKNASGEISVSMQAQQKISGTLFQKEFLSPATEADGICREVERLIGGSSHRVVEGLAQQQTTQKSTASITAEEGNFSFRDIGIICRTTRQAETIALALSRQGLPYQLLHTNAFYTQEPCKILYLWVLLLTEKISLEDTLYLLAQEKGVGKATLNTIRQQIRHIQQKQKETKCSVAYALQVLFGLADLHVQTRPEAYLSASVQQRLRRFTRIYSEARGLPSVQEASLTDLSAFSSLSGMSPARSTGDEQESDHQERGLHPLLDLLCTSYDIQEHPELDRFRSLANSYGQSLASFSAYLENYSHSIVYDERAECITLSTVHAAKGLEFPVVFVAGVEKDMLPLAPREKLDSEALHMHVEEERRLFYVGLTRASQYLYLSWCKERACQGGKGKSTTLKTTGPSPFMTELPQDLLQDFPYPIESKKKQANRQKWQQISLF